MPGRPDVADRHGSISTPGLSRHSGSSQRLAARIASSVAGAVLHRQEVLLDPPDAVLGRHAPAAGDDGRGELGVDGLGALQLGFVPGQDVDVEVVVADVPEDGVVEPGLGEPRLVEVEDPAEVLVLDGHVGGELVQRRMLLAAPGDRGVDALGHGVPEGADVLQRLVVDAGQAGGLVAAGGGHVRQHALDRGVERGLVVVGELREHRTAPRRRMGQHPRHFRLAGLAAPARASARRGIRSRSVRSAPSPRRSLDQGERLRRRREALQERQPRRRSPASAGRSRR